MDMDHPATQQQHRMLPDTWYDVQVVHDVKMINRNAMYLLFFFAISVPTGSQTAN